MEELAATDEEDSIVGTKVESEAVLPGNEDVSRTLELATVDPVDIAVDDWTGISEVATIEDRTIDEVATISDEIGVLELITADELNNPDELLMTGIDVLAAAEVDPGAVERTLLLEGIATEDKVLLTEMYTEDDCDSEILKVGSTEEGSIDERLDTTAELGRVGSTLPCDDTGPIDEEGLPELPGIEVDSGRLLPEEVVSEALLVAAGLEVNWLETIGTVVVIDSGPALDEGKAEDVGTVEDGAAEQALG